MTVLAHAAVAASLVAACLASPQPQPPEGVWLFQREPARTGHECRAVLDRDVAGWQLAFVERTDGAGGLEMRLAGTGAVSAAPAGSLGTIEFSGGTVHMVEVGPAAGPGGTLPLRPVDAKALAAATPSADGMMWLELPDTPALAFPLTGWREAMRGVAACAS